MAVSSYTVDVACRAGMHKQDGVGEAARGCPWSSSKKAEAARCAAAHSKEHSPTSDPAPDHITAPVVDARYGVLVLAPHGEGPRRESCIERLGSVRYMLRAGPDNRTSHRKPPVRRDSASPRSTCPTPLRFRNPNARKSDHGWARDRAEPNRENGPARGRHEKRLRTGPPSWSRQQNSSQLPRPTFPVGTVGAVLTLVTRSSRPGLVARAQGSSP